MDQHEKVKSDVDLLYMKSDIHQQERWFGSSNTDPNKKWRGLLAFATRSEYNGLNCHQLMTAKGGSSKNRRSELRVSMRGAQ